MHSFISLPAFIISFAIGLFFIYAWGPDIKTIIAYPTPDNASKIQYKDQADNCFTFIPHEKKCPFMSNSIKQIPIQV